MLRARWKEIDPLQERPGEPGREMETQKEAEGNARDHNVTAMTASSAGS